MKKSTSSLPAVCRLLLLVVCWWGGVQHAQADVPQAGEDSEPVVQEVHETEFKAFTTHHPKFIALMHSPWDATCKKAVASFKAAAHVSKQLLEERGQEPIVFVTVCSVTVWSPFVVAPLIKAIARSFVMRACVYYWWANCRWTARRARVFVKGLGPRVSLLRALASSTSQAQI